MRKRYRVYPVVKIFYGPVPHMFFYCTADVLDSEPDLYASSPAEWLRRNPDATPAEIDRLTDEMHGVGIVPGTN